MVERWILVSLRHKRLASADNLNEAIAPQPFQKLPDSRASTLADLDAPALQNMPLQPWEFAMFWTVRVHIDHHIEVDGHRYSVPQALVARKAPMSLVLCNWIDSGHSVLITGPTDAGKSWPAHWRSTPAGAGILLSINACHAWASSCASATATARLAIG